MAEETQSQTQIRESGFSGTANPTSSSETPRRNARGLILGPDGKPCRACNSFADLMSQSRKVTKTASAQVPFQAAPPSDCPPDVEQLGRSSWTLLHSITASYPEKPTPMDQSNVKQFLGLFGKLYPCWVCAEDFQVWMENNRVRAESRDAFGRWMCEAHNDVNKKLGKREFDCNKWEERWRTGWQDGRCD